MSEVTYDAMKRRLEKLEKFATEYLVCFDMWQITNSSGNEPELDYAAWLAGLARAALEGGKHE
jgi:hypothetical protein